MNPFFDMADDCEKILEDEMLQNKYSVTVMKRVKGLLKPTYFKRNIKKKTITNRES